MGYNTTFKGHLGFSSPLTEEQETALGSMFDEDCRCHPEWGNTSLSYMDFEFTADMTGIQWNGAEKSYEMTEKVNLMTEVMRRKWPDFSFTGYLEAYGEEAGDLWVLKIQPDGVAKRVQAKLVPVE